jgi:hypothetical protein
VTGVGLLTGLLGLPLAPVRGALWVTGKVAEAAAQEQYHPTRIHAQLRELARQLEAGAITEEEFDLAEDELLDRLAAATAGERIRPR